MSESPPEEPAADIRGEAARLSAAVVDAGVAGRLMGGLAIWLRCPSAREPAYARSYDDLDFAVTTRSVAGIKTVLEAQGYLPDKFFNGLHGATRLYYRAADGRWTVDVVVDALVMSHRLDLRTRLDHRTPTVPLADLLLTKLQVWEINHKDLVDALCVLADHPLVEDDRDEEGISLPRIRAVLGADWGFCHTVEGNLRKVAGVWAEQAVAGRPFDPAAQVEALLRAIEAAPKSLGWKARARVGERVRWYETPEEVGH